MSKKVLNESEIKKFMKYANIGGLSKGFISRLNEGGMSYGRDDDMMEQPEDEEMDMGAEEAPDDMGAEEPEMDMGAEEPMGDEEGGDIEAEVVVPEEDVDALKVARDVLDKILGAAGEGGEEDLEMGGEEEEMPEEEPLEGGEEELEMGDEEEEEVMQELEAAGIQLQEIDHSLVKEVTRRVAHRILEGAKKTRKTRKARR